MGMLFLSIRRIVAIARTRLSVRTWGGARGVRGAGADSMMGRGNYMAVEARIVQLFVTFGEARLRGL